MNVSPRFPHPNSRFWTHIRKTPTCWIWTGTRDKNGYGRFTPRHGSSAKLAHRLIYEALVGSIGHRVLLHSCDNPSCVNPNHLNPGSQVQNIVDAIQKGRARHWCGSSNPKAKLTDEQRAEIVRVANSGISQRSLARRFGIRQSAVWGLIHRSIRGPSPGYELHPKQERVPELVAQLAHEAKRLNESIQLVLATPWASPKKGR